MSSRPARTAGLLAAAVLLPCCGTDVGSGEQASQITVRASQKQGDGEVDGFTGPPRISSDGRWVLFDSDASDLVFGDINPGRDVFLKDRTDGSVHLVSIRDPGDQAFNEDATAVDVSDDGNRILFQSTAGYGGFTNSNNTLFIRDRAAARTLRVTGTIDGNNFVGGGTISRDGLSVVFQSAATNLGFAGVALPQIYLAQVAPSLPAWPAALPNPTLTLVSRSTVSGTTPSNGFNSDAKIVGNGPAVVFGSNSTNLPSGVAATANHIYYAVANPTTPNLTTVEFVSYNAGGAATTGGMGSASADGRYVCFESSNANVQPARILVRDRVAGTTSSAFDEPYLGGLVPSHYPVISAGGRYVVWWSGASPLGDAPSHSHAYLRDRQTGLAERLSVDTFGQAGDAAASLPQVSGDERWVVFMSSASNLVVGDTNGKHDVFVRGPRN